MMIRRVCGLFWNQAKLNDADEIQAHPISTQVDKSKQY